jgi:hypothetical protein
MNHISYDVWVAIWRVGLWFHELCFAQRADMHQVGDTEQPVALITEEGKQCNQRQLRIHLAYVAALLGSHRSVTPTTHCGILTLNCQKE